MRRNEKLIAELSEINDIMAKGEVIRIAMVDGGKPYVVPMSYGVVDGALYLHCAHEGRKVFVLKENPNVCFEVSVDQKLVKAGQGCGWTYHFRSVIGTGKAVFVDDLNEKLVGLSSIMEHYGSSEHTFADAAVEKTLVIRIDIEEMTGKKSPANKNL